MRPGDMRAGQSNDGLEGERWQGPAVCMFCLSVVFCGGGRETVAVIMKGRPSANLSWAFVVSKTFTSKTIIIVL